MTGGPNRRLDSWKEIADYIGRDVRTAIRWEKQRGLPVHRVPGGIRQAVFAYAAEIDAWVSAASSSEAPPTEPTPPFVHQSEASQPQLRRRRLRWAGLAFAAIAVVALWLSSGWRVSSTASPAPLERPLAFVRTDYPARMPMSIAAGDLNGDGRADLAFTNASDGALGVLLGDGDGGFLPRISLAVGKQPERLALADFNGDNKLDLVVTDWTLGEIKILLGKGDGDFSSGAHYPVGGRARWVSAGDLNRDGKADVVVAGSASNRIWVFAGRGNGTFSQAASYDAERDVSSLALGDFNGDGHLDVAAGDYRVGTGRNVSVYLGDGKLNFGPRLLSACGEGPLGIAAADLNSDGKLDLVTADFRAGASLLFGIGDGRLQGSPALKAGDAPGFVQIADLDRDGKLDLLVLNEHSDDASVLLGDGNGRFEKPFQIAAGRYPDAAALADFNGDGRLDFATANVYGGSISVFLNRTPARQAKGWPARALLAAMHR